MNSTPMPTPRPAPKRAQRKPKAKLPPAIAHEMDVLRAARMGIDISYMGPEERCKYPSKFCCNMRARKSTGKLHRFCEYHRSRANVNQKRWTDIRRSHETNQEMVANALALCANDSEWVDISMPLITAAVAQSMPMTPLAITTPAKQLEELHQHKPRSPTHVSALLDDEIPISEDDIDYLTSIVAESEKNDGSAFIPLEDLMLMHMLQDLESPVVTPTVFDRIEMGVL